MCGHAWHDRMPVVGAPGALVMWFRFDCNARLRSVWDRDTRASTGIE